MTRYSTSRPTTADRQAGKASHSSRSCSVACWYSDAAVWETASDRHQDAPLWPSILPNTMITAWVPMDDVEPANGAMWMLPGSHTWGDQHSSGSIIDASTVDGSALAELDGFGDLDLTGFSPPVVPGPQPVSTPRPCPVHRGQVHFHHSLTWHGSPNNSSPDRRRAIGIHYMTGDTFFVESGGHLMQKFVHEHGAIGDGGLMLEAGPHFPQVMRHGVLRTPEQSPRPKPGAGVIRTGVIRATNGSVVR